MQDEYYHYYKIVNVKNTEKQIKGLEFLFVELPKFKPQGRAEKKLHELWLRFLTEINEKTKEIPEEMMQNKDISEAIGYMERSAYTKEELDAYFQWKVDAMTSTAMIDNAREEGKTVGKMEVALNALMMGMSIEDASNLTGLSKQQIEELKLRH